MGWTIRKDKQYWKREATQAHGTISHLQSEVFRHKKLLEDVITQHGEELKKLEDAHLLHQD